MQSYPVSFNGRSEDGLFDQSVGPNQLSSCHVRGSQEQHVCRVNLRGRMTVGVALTPQMAGAVESSSHKFTKEKFEYTDLLEYTQGQLNQSGRQLFGVVFEKKRFRPTSSG